VTLRHGFDKQAIYGCNLETYILYMVLDSISSLIVSWWRRAYDWLDPGRI